MLSVSADGVIKQWDSISGQVSRSRPPHTLGIVSLSCDAKGERALWGSLEGLVCLWDLSTGKGQEGRWESYVRTGREEGGVEPGE